MCGISGLLLPVGRDDPKAADRVGRMVECSRHRGPDGCGVDVVSRPGRPVVAFGHNRLAIMLPCHRVVGAGGKLVGFGGGLPRKRFLLELEARVRVERDFAS